MRHDEHDPLARILSRRQLLALGGSMVPCLLGSQAWSASAAPPKRIYVQPLVPGAAGGSPIELMTIYRTIMVMKQPSSPKPARHYPLRPRRLSVAEAKAKLSEALRSIRSGPSVIHNRGRDVAVLIDVEQYEQLILDQQAAGAQTPVKSFLDRLQQIKQLHGGGVDAFEPRRIDYRPRKPFSGRA